MLGRLKKQSIYLDYSATTPIDPAVLQEMMPYLKQEFGNPSSLHSYGQAAAAAVERARSRCAQFLHCSPQEIFFTGGATEANNTVIQGVVRHSPFVPHIITSAIEHESVLSLCETLQEKGAAEITYLPVDKDGILKVEELEKAVKENTVLVSIMYVNSVIGTIQPIATIGKLIAKINQERSKERKILFHTDAVQAANYLDCNVKNLMVDFLTLSSHKVYGPKGVGLLYCRERSALMPLLIGGGQEMGVRAGTHNVVGIVGFGSALDRIKSKEHQESKKNIETLRNRMVEQVLRSIPKSSLNGSKERRIPSNAHFRFDGVQGRDLVTLLDQQGIAVSTGSACSENKEEPDHVILSLGSTSEEAISSLRVTLGKYTTSNDIKRFLSVLPHIITQLRS